MPDIDRAYTQLLDAILTYKDIHGSAKLTELLEQELHRERAAQRIREDRQAQGGCTCKPERLVPRRVNTGSDGSDK